MSFRSRDRISAGSTVAATLMKVLVWLISAMNVYLDLRCFLNAIHVLHTAKYSQTTTVIFAILFLGLGVAGIYVLLAKHDPKLALIIGVGPWVLSIVVMFFTMILSNQQ
jgi:hypothetical protein